MKRWLLPLLFGLAATFVLLIIVAFVRTAFHAPSPDIVEATPSEFALSPGAAERLAGSLRFQTISSDDPATFDQTSFVGLHEYLRTSFPRVHSELRRESVGEQSVLYTWQGQDPRLPSILLMGHLDVVPIEPGTEGKWQEDPFAGRIVDGVIWGRGAIDNKSTVVGLLEAAEALLKEGFRPPRTIYFAFGHDEEVGGRGGAQRIAELLRGRGVKLEMVLDEGGVIGDGVLPGVKKPVALIGIAEKGFVTVELSAQTSGGHSSLPPRQSAVGIVSAAVARLEENQMEARFDGAARQLFDRVSREFSLIQRAVFANLWLTRPLVTQRLEGDPTTNAMVRTTTAATVVEGGSKANVLPSYARALVNFRILPGDSIDAVVAHVGRAVNDPRVQIKTTGFTAEPSSLSSTEAQSFQRLQRAVRITTPDVIVSPFLVVVVTDARYFADLSANVYRFSPIRLNPDGLTSIHGLNERISVAHYERAVRTYRQIMIEVSAQ